MTKNYVASAKNLVVAGVLLGTLATAAAAREDNDDRRRERMPVAVTLPLSPGWFEGAPAPYISTEASDPGVAKAMNSNYVARLGAAANTDAVDDIYTVTNFAQANILPSRPNPAGPRNKDTNYTPLWQVSTVTWNPGSTPRLLTSENAVREAAAADEVTVAKTNIVVNCSVVYTPSGGLFPNAQLEFKRDR